MENYASSDCIRLPHGAVGVLFMSRITQVRPIKPLVGSMNGLVRTKLNMPLLKTKMLPRTHLLTRLSNGKHAPLVVVSGAAGSGKTSLVCQWAIRDSLRVVWYSLDEDDNDIDLFFRYLFAGLSKIKGALPLTIADHGGRSTKPGRESVALLIELLADLQEDIYFVLDDYHLITSPQIHDALSYFLDHITDKTHIVITSRTVAPFSFGHFKIRDQMVEIPAYDMKFSNEETEAFFKEVIPVKLSVEALHEITRQVEGWVGGLQLLGLSLQDKDVPKDIGAVLTRVSREAADYLTNEIMEDQPPDIRNFLQATAFLDRFNAEVAAEVTGLKQTREIIDHIYRRNLFLIPLDDSHTWYRYHHLFSGAVRERMKISSPELAGDICKRAALWFAQNDYLEDAFRNAFDSGDYDFAADLMEDYSLYMHEHYEFASGIRWLRKLPSNVVAERTLLQLYECGPTLESLQISEIATTINNIEKKRAAAFERYEGVKKNLATDLFICAKSMLEYYYRDPAHADREQLNRASEMISSQNGQFAGYIKFPISLSYLLDGMPSAACATLREAQPLLFSSQSIWPRTLWFRMMAGAERMRGHLCRSEAILSEAFELLQQKEMAEAPMRFILYMPMAWVAYHHNELDKAFEYALGATEYGKRASYTRDRLEGLLVLALTHLARGEKEEAAVSIRNMIKVNKEVEVPDIGFSAEAWAVRISLALGHIQYAAKWAEETRRNEDEPFSSRFVDESIARAQLLYRQHRFGDSEELLEKVRSACVDHDMLEAVLTMDLFRCIVLDAMGERTRARNVMEKALAYGENEGYLRLFLNHLPELMPIFREMTESGYSLPGSLHLKTIMKSYAADSGPQEACSAWGLSQREVEVLRLMSADFQYKEIAGRMFVSLETIRSHTKHIFRKLGVSSRSEAVRRATEMGILQKRT